MAHLEFEAAADAIARISHELHGRGWVPATSGNFSTRIEAGEFAITASGRDKARIRAEDVLRLDAQGRVTGGDKPSAETGLHLQLYRRDPAIGAVLHTHSLNAVLASMQAADEIAFERLELLKAFTGIASHETAVEVPVFENSQDIGDLAATVEEYMGRHGQGHAYLIRGHGIYTWGRDLDESLRHLEAMEHLLGYYLGMNRGLQG